MNHLVIMDFMILVNSSNSIFPSEFESVSFRIESQSALSFLLCSPSNTDLSSSTDMKPDLSFLSKVVKTYSVN